MIHRFLFLLLISPVALFAQKPIFVDAKLKNATVYYNSAELTHTTSLNIPKGTSEVVIKNVANDLNENTVRIAAPKNVTIMSVQFTDNYVSEYELDLTSPKMKSVSDSIKIVQKEIKKIQNKRTSDQKTIDLLDKNQTVTGGNNGLIMRKWNMHSGNCGSGCQTKILHMDNFYNDSSNVDPNY